jgi:hyperosmotically inducible protein
MRARNLKKEASGLRMPKRILAENNTMRSSNILLTAVFVCAASMIGAAQTPAPDTPKPDNTKVNKRDKNPGEVTADQQKENATDRDLTKNIRRSIMADKGLSTYAHNIKIISQNGNVTLKGPVKSEDEKKAVLAKAVAVTGSADKVTDQVSVKQ